MIIIRRKYTLISQRPLHAKYTSSRQRIIEVKQHLAWVDNTWMTEQLKNWLIHVMLAFPRLTLGNVDRLFLKLPLGFICNYSNIYNEYIYALEGAK